MCECRCARDEQLDDDSYHITSYEVDGPHGPQILWIFPREPSWWRDNDDDAEQKRQRIFREFDSAELVTLINEVWMYIRTPPENASEVAQLVRRLLSLAWMTEVCVGSLEYVHDDDAITRHVRYWQGRAAQYLSEAGWNIALKSASARTTVEGITRAMKSEREYEGRDQ